MLTQRPDPVDLTWPEDRPELLPFLPLVHAAWSDGVLTESEIEALALKIEGQLWLSGEDLRELRRWLQPGRPPSPASLARLRHRMRDMAPAIPGSEQSSLARFGVALARSAGGGDGPWSQAEARRALEEVEAALGTMGAEAVRRILQVGPAPEARTAVEAEDALFRVQGMRDYLDRPHAELRHRVLRLMEGKFPAFPPELERTTYRARVLEASRIVASAGLGGLAFPPEFGGESAPDRAIVVFETLALGDLSVLVKFGVQFGLFGGSILQLGTERHHERFLRDVATLELPGCYAMTEVGHGSNVRDLETRATWDGETGEFVVHTPHDDARKDWIGNAALHGHLATVFARLVVGEEDHGIHAFLVPLRDGDGRPLPGVGIEDCGAKVGLNGVDNGRLRFQHVRIPRESLLDRFGRVTEDGRYESPIPSAGRRFFTMLGTLVAGRISIAVASVSAAKRGLAFAVRYSEERRQFGPAGEPEVPILDYLTQQRLLLPRLAATYGLHFALRELVDDYGSHMTRPSPRETGDDTEARELETRAAGLKAYASRHCVDSLQAAREGCGGQGYLAENGLGRLRADTDIFTTFEGANVVLLQLVAKGLLSRFRDEMGDLTLLGTVRWIAERAGTRVAELNPVATRRTDRDHLRDPEFHLSAFTHREERLTVSLARRLKARLDEGMDSFDAVVACQDHMVTLARAHVERTILEAFHRGVTRAPSPGLSEVLRNLAQLWALGRLETHRGWYLEAGYVEGSKARAIRSEVNALCGEVREQARFLVEAWGVPVIR
jgi:acyl-CoA oxidase